MTISQKCLFSQKSDYLNRFRVKFPFWKYILLYTFTKRYKIARVAPSLKFESKNSFVYGRHIIIMYCGTSALTAHNWQKLKKSILLMPLPWNLQGRSWSFKKFQLYFLKSRYLWVRDIWGNFLKIWYFVNISLIKVWI